MHSRGVAEGSPRFLLLCISCTQIALVHSPSLSMVTVVLLSRCCAACVLQGSDSAESNSEALCMLQAYLLFGDEQYLQMFTLSYLAAMHALPLHLLPEAAAGTPDPPPWLTNAHMDTGKLTQPWISSLSAFWPGLQALSGKSPLNSGTTLCRQSS